MARLLVAIVLGLSLPAWAKASTGPAGDAGGGPPATTSAAPAPDADSEPADDPADEKDEKDEKSAKNDGDSASSDKDDESDDAAEAAAEKETSSDAEQDADSAADTKSDDEKKSEKAGDDDDKAKPADDGDDKKSASDEKDEKKAEKKKPETHQVAAKDLRIELDVEGVFVAQDMTEVAVRPKVWTSFKVEEAVEHGTRVHKGDVLVKFDDEDIEKAIEKQNLEERLGELALMQAEEEFPRQEKTIDLNYQIAKRSYEQDVDEYDRFKKVMRDLSVKMADYYLKSAEQQLANAQEELDQLQKMYEADDITEETEEIVLKRQKFEVEMADFYVKYTRINHDYTLNVSIPRRDEMLSMAVEQSKLSFDEANMVKSLGLSRQRYELESLREQRANSVERHAELVADRALMTLRAPADGLAYYGRQIDGRWIEVGTMESKLAPYGSVAPNSVVMTVVSDRPLYVQTSVGEKDFPDVEAEQAVVVRPVSDDEVKLTGAVKKLSDVPGSGNKFSVEVELDGADEGPEWLKPGMSCKAKITTYEAEDAVVIPAELVQTDEDDEDQKYVMVVADEDDEPMRRNIKLGKSKAKDVEVLKGLEVGDLIAKGVKDEPQDDESSSK